MTESTLPVSVFGRFIEALRAQIGMDAYKAVFEKAELPANWMDPKHMPGLDEASAAQAYSQLQSTMRIYYGRGARGILLRIGGVMWEQVLNDSPFAVKAQARLIRALPPAARLEPALNVLAKILSKNADDMTVYSLDLDWLLVDRISPATLGCREPAPICFVTLGLIHECLFWAAGREFDIEETSCRAMDEKECHFKILAEAKS